MSKNVKSRQKSGKKAKFGKKHKIAKSTFPKNVAGRRGRRGNVAGTSRERRGHPAENGRKRRGNVAGTLFLGKNAQKCPKIIQTV